MLLRLFVITLLVKKSVSCKDFHGVFIGTWLFFIGTWLFFIGTWLFFIGTWLLVCYNHANKPRINWYFILGISQTFG